MKRLSVVIPTLNEEKNIRGLLENIKDFADEIVVVDMFSSDRTVEICREYTDRILQHNEDRVLNININLGIDKAEGEWILQLDADERLSPELKVEIKDAISSNRYDVYEIPFKHYFFGRFMTDGGWHWPIKRLYKKKAARYECKLVHEPIKTNARVGTLINPIMHYAHPTIEAFIVKMNLYTSQAAVSRYGKGESASLISMIMKPMKVFMYRYVMHKGYKEGMHGFVLSALMVFYTFCEEIKVWELGYRKKYNLNQDSTVTDNPDRRLTE